MKYKLSEDKIGDQSMLGPGPDSCLRMSGNNMLFFKGSKGKFSVTVTMKDSVVL